MRRAIAAAAGVLALALGATSPAMGAVKVFLPRGEQLVAVERPGTTTEDALRELLRGPTAAERRTGYRTTSRAAPRCAAWASPERARRSTSG